MSTRSVMALLLVVAISLTTAVPPASASANLHGRVEDEARLTPEEEREARELVQKFDERFRATNDIGPIIDELFVNDFPERLRQARNDWMPWALLNKSLAAYAGSDELRRYYVATMNFFALFFRLSEVAEALKKQAGDDEAALNAEETLTPEVIEVLRSDPTLAKFAREFKKEEENDRAEEVKDNQPAESVDSTQAADATSQADDDSATEEDEMGVIKGVSQLNNVSATLEKANELMRKRLANMPLIPPVASSDDSTESQQTSSKPDLTSLDEGEYGYPKGTPSIFVDATPLCLQLVRIDGQLRILAVAICVD